MFRRLSACAVPWAQVTVTLVDERWVGIDDPASNEAMVRRELLVGRASAATFIGLYTGGVDPRTCVAACDSRLAAVHQPFDVCLLGLGDDGHTASWFPGGAGLTSALDVASSTRCTATRPAFDSPARMTWCLGPVVASRRLVLHFVGATKWSVLERAASPGPVEALPIRAVLAAAPEPVAVYWAPA